MTRNAAIAAVALVLAALPAHAQSARAKAKQDSIARASGAKPVEKPAPAAAQAAGASQGMPGTQMSLQREVFSYSDGGRRDPMVSLMNTADLRPLITEVQVIGILYDEEGMNSMAILRNTVDKKTQYHVKIGQMLGRMKVTQITRKEVVFTIDEFGFSRQERLAVKPDTTVARTP